MVKYDIKKVINNLDLNEKQIFIRVHNDRGYSDLIHSSSNFLPFFLLKKNDKYIPNIEIYTDSTRKKRIEDNLPEIPSKYMEFNDTNIKTFADIVKFLKERFPKYEKVYDNKKDFLYYFKCDANNFLVYGLHHDYYEKYIEESINHYNENNKSDKISRKNIFLLHIDQIEIKIEDVNKDELKLSNITKMKAKVSIMGALPLKMTRHEHTKDGTDIYFNLRNPKTHKMGNSVKKRMNRLIYKLENINRELALWGLDNQSIIYYFPDTIIRTGFEKYSLKMSSKRFQERINLKREIFSKKREMTSDQMKKKVSQYCIPAHCNKLIEENGEMICPYGIKPTSKSTLGEYALVRVNSKGEQIKSNRFCDFYVCKKEFIPSEENEIWDLPNRSIKNLTQIKNEIEDLFSKKIEIYPIDPYFKDGFFPLSDNAKLAPFSLLISLYMNFLPTLIHDYKKVKEKLKDIEKTLTTLKRQHFADTEQVEMNLFNVTLLGQLNKLATMKRKGLKDYKSSFERLEYRYIGEFEEFSRENKHTIQIAHEFLIDFYNTLIETQINHPKKLQKQELQMDKETDFYWGWKHPIKVGDFVMGLDSQMDYLERYRSKQMKFKNIGRIDGEDFDLVAPSLNSSFLKNKDKIIELLKEPYISAYDLLRVYEITKINRKKDNSITTMTLLFKENPLIDKEKEIKALYSSEGRSYSFFKLDIPNPKSFYDSKINDPLSEFFRKPKTKPKTKPKIKAKSEKPSMDWTVKEMNVYAKDNKIDLGKARLKSDIFKKITSKPKTKPKKKAKPKPKKTEVSEIQSGIYNSDKYIIFLGRVGENINIIQTTKSRGSTKTFDFKNEQKALDFLNNLNPTYVSSHSDGLYEFFNILNNKDAMVLSKSMFVIRNPQLIEALGNLDPYLHTMAEILNISVIDLKQGSPFFHFGTGLEPLYDKDLLSGIISAISSVFYLETKTKFNSFIFEKEKDPKTYIVGQISDNFLLVAVYNETLKTSDFSNLDRNIVRSILDELNLYKVKETLEYLINSLESLL